MSGKVGEDEEKMAEGSKMSGDGGKAPESEAEAISRRRMVRTGEDERKLPWSQALLSSWC